MKYKSGYSVIEVLLAGSILALAVAGIVGAIVLAQRNNQATNAQTQALKMAQEGIDALRSIRNRNYSLLVNTVSPASLVLTDGVWSINTTPGSNDDQLLDPLRTRRITIERDPDLNDSGDLEGLVAKKVTVTVTYQINPDGDTKDIVLTETLANTSTMSDTGDIVTGVTAQSANFRLLDDSVGGGVNSFNP